MTWQSVVETLQAYWGLWLMLIFLAIVFWAFRPKNKAKFEAMGKIPFKDDDKGGPADAH